MYKNGDYNVHCVTAFFFFIGCNEYIIGALRLVDLNDVIVDGACAVSRLSSFLLLFVLLLLLSLLIYYCVCGRDSASRGKGEGKGAKETVVLVSDWLSPMRAWLKSVICFCAHTRDPLFRSALRRVCLLSS